jgi:hypothetical protein
VNTNDKDHYIASLEDNNKRLRKDLRDKLVELQAQSHDEIKEQRELEPWRYAGWRIYSLEHGQWWKSNACGYTHNEGEAGAYTFDEALKICKEANVTTTQEVMVLERKQ